jgi:hypothetical protein
MSERADTRKSPRRCFHDACSHIKRPTSITIPQCNWISVSCLHEVTSHKTTHIFIWCNKPLRDYTGNKISFYYNTQCFTIDSVIHAIISSWEGIFIWIPSKRTETCWLGYIEWGCRDVGGTGIQDKGQVGGEEELAGSRDSSINGLMRVTETTGVWLGGKR